MRKLIILIITLSLIGCNNKEDCRNLPKSFSSYETAISEIKSTSFKIKDEADCSKSTWLSDASYYSCNEKAGYFIMTTKTGREYIHEKVPVEIWQQFKKSDSFGNFYNTHIRGRYKMELSPVMVI